MDEDIVLFESEGFDFILYDILGMDWIEVIVLGGGRRKAPMAGAPHIVMRQRTEEEEEQLRLLKLLNDANNAKKLKRWQEAENENARKKHNALLFARFDQEATKRKTSGFPDVKKANREIAKREAEAERQRQDKIRQVRLTNLEKARKAKK
jgi:hypothetical protein